jgi:hypothetical protein
VEGDSVKMRKGWLIIWPDGTEWKGDCPRWAASPIMAGARLVPMRILGKGRWPCPECIHGTHR